MSESQHPHGHSDSSSPTAPYASWRPALEDKLGRFELLSKLGSGGMGTVYRARDTRSGKHVALKMLFDVEPTGVYRLKREFRRMCDISHENLVTLFELFHEGCDWFFTMELLIGVDLKTAMRASFADNYAGLRGLLRQLTRAVHALHQAGKIHRDLKPSNVLVTPQQRVVVLDFGLVDEVDHRTLFGSAEGLVHGTPLYMAPEQAAGQFATPASDWYTVGTILFEVLTDRCPFPGGAMEVLIDKQYEDAPRVKSVVPQIPADLDDLVAALMHKVPAQRPGAAEILSWCAGNAVHTSFRRRPPSLGNLLERERPMAILHDALEGVLQGDSACVDLTGLTGLGKSALVHHFAEGVAAHGVILLEGNCSQQESLPFRAFDGLVDAITAHLFRLGAEEREALLLDLGSRLSALAQIFPVLARLEAVARQPLSTSDPHEMRRQAFQGLKLLLSRIAERRPTIIFLDNLQWGDADSAYLLDDLLAAPSVPAALFILSFRHSDTITLRNLHLQRTLVTPAYALYSVELGPLSPVGSIEFARDLQTDMREPRRTRVAQQVARESGGNPALIRALVEELGRHGVEAATSLSGEGDLLRRLVRVRLARVSSEARELLGRVLVAGCPLPLSLLLQTGDWQHDLLALVGQLRRQDLVLLEGEADDPRVSPPGDAIAQVALASLDPALIQRSHGGLAEAFVLTDAGNTEAIARHFYAAGLLDQAFEHASNAANAASKALAFDRAAELYRLALECRPGLWSLQKSCAEALVQAGRGAEAAPLFLLAAEAAPTRTSLQLKREAAEHFFNHGDLERGSEILRPLLHEAGIEAPTDKRELGNLLIKETTHLGTRGLDFIERSEFEISRSELTRIDLLWIAGKGLLLNDPGRAGYFLTRCVRLALEAGEPRRVIRALALCGVVFSGQNHALGPMMLAKSQQLNEQIHDHYGFGLEVICRGIAARHRGQWMAALADLDNGVQYLREHCPGKIWECGLAQASTMVALEALGELRTMGERTEVMLRRAQETGDAHTGLIAAIYSALTLLATGHTSKARVRVRNALSHWPRAGFQIHHLHALKIEIYCDLYEGHPFAAWQRVVAAWPALQNSDFLSVSNRRAEALMLRVRAGLAALAAAPTEQQHIKAIITDDLTQLEKEGHAHLRAETALFRAGLAARVSDRASHRRYLSLARKGFDSAGMQLGSALVQRIFGRLDGQSGVKEVARAESLIRMQNIKDVDAWQRLAAPGCGL